MIGRNSVAFFCQVLFLYWVGFVFLPAVLFKLVKFGKRHQAFVANELAGLRVSNNRN